MKWLFTRIHIEEYHNSVSETLFHIDTSVHDAEHRAMKMACDWLKEETEY